MKTTKELYYQAARDALEIIETWDRSYGKKPDAERLCWQIFSDLLETRRLQETEQRFNVVEVVNLSEEVKQEIKDLVQKT